MISIWQVSTKLGEGSQRGCGWVEIHGWAASQNIQLHVRHCMDERHIMGQGMSHEVSQANQVGVLRDCEDEVLGLLSKASDFRSRQCPRHAAIIDNDSAQISPLVVVASQHLTRSILAE